MDKEFHHTEKLCEKLSESISKLQEVNANILRMITIHEHRHEQHERAETEVKDDIKELHSRITTVNREIHERIDEVERHISERIDALRSDLIQHKKEENGNMVGDTLKEIDKYKWMILGAAIAIGWIIGNVNLGVLGTLFK